MRPFTLQEHVDLAAYTTFGIHAEARWFADITSLETLRAALDWARSHNRELLVLGGGSNMLLHDDVDALGGPNPDRRCGGGDDGGRHIRVAVGAGEVWHDFVMDTLDKGWGGLENLSLIPGSVGASPMQNIGAYGVEIKDHFAWLDAVRLSDGALQRFNAEDCAFGYRESVFKREERASGFWCRWPSISTERARCAWATVPSKQELAPAPGRPNAQGCERCGHPHPTLQVAGPAIGNAGSFFKNPTVPASVADALLRPHPHMPNYPHPQARSNLQPVGSLNRRDGKVTTEKPTAFTTGKPWSWCTLGRHRKRSVGLGPRHHGVCGIKFGVALEPEVNQIGQGALTISIFDAGVVGRLWIAAACHVPEVFHAEFVRSG